MTMVTNDSTLKYFNPSDKLVYHTVMVLFCYIFCVELQQCVFCPQVLLFAVLAVAASEVAKRQAIVGESLYHYTI